MKKPTEDRIPINTIVADTVLTYLNYDRVSMPAIPIQERGKRAVVATTFLNRLGIKKAIRYSIQEKEFKLYDL